MNGLNNIMYYPNLDESVRAGIGKSANPEKAANQVEQVFLGELLKNMLENTDFGKSQMVSDYMPYITSEIAKSLSERGIGIHDFLMKSPSFKGMVEKQGTTEGTDNKAPAQSGKDLKVKLQSGISSYAYGKVIKH